MGKLLHISLSNNKNNNKLYEKIEIHNSSFFNIFNEVLNENINNLLNILYNFKYTKEIVSKGLKSLEKSNKLVLNIDLTNKKCKNDFKKIILNIISNFMLKNEVYVEKEKDLEPLLIKTCDIVTEELSEFDLNIKKSEIDPSKITKSLSLVTNKILRFILNYIFVRKYFDLSENDFFYVNKLKNIQKDINNTETIEKFKDILVNIFAKILNCYRHKSSFFCSMWVSCNKKLINIYWLSNVIEKGKNCSGKEIEETINIQFKINNEKSTRFAHDITKIISDINNNCNEIIIYNMKDKEIFLKKLAINYIKEKPNKKKSKKIIFENEEETSKTEKKESKKLEKEDIDKKVSDEKNSKNLKKLENKQEKKNIKVNVKNKKNNLEEKKSIKSKNELKFEEFNMDEENLKNVIVTILPYLKEIFKIDKIKNFAKILLYLGYIDLNTNVIIKNKIVIMSSKNIEYFNIINNIFILNDSFILLDNDKFLNNKINSEYVILKDNKDTNIELEKYLKIFQKHDNLKLIIETDKTSRDIFLYNMKDDHSLFNKVKKMMNNHYIYIDSNKIMKEILKKIKQIIQELNIEDGLDYLLLNFKDILKNKTVIKELRSYISKIIDTKYNTDENNSFDLSFD